MSDVTMLNEGVHCRAQGDCPACGTEGRVIHDKQRDQLFQAPGIWSIRQCADAACSLAWIDPMPDAGDLGKFYSSYYTHSAGEGAAAVASPGLAKRVLAAIFPGRRLQFLSSLMHFGDMAPGDMLEVGCGSGHFLAQAAAAGWRVMGIDFDEAAVAAARAIPGVDAQAMDMHDPALDGKRFDGIAFNNVIEHLPDPARVFARCHALLAPGGRVVMVTPNIQAQCHAVFGEHWRGLEVPRHIYLFSAQALHKFAANAGFRNIQVFSPLNGNQIDFMADASIEIAEKAGATPPQVDRRTLKLRNAATALLGGTIGEWVVLVAER
ncbi:MAG: methyltransferase domain-containing protein [Sphingobium sp.]|nr:methyltransferase domain-containing protein [Sphingobium sp.]